MIYLDNNATTRPSPAVVRAATAALEDAWHNPSSVHRPGQAARATVELARAETARLINAKPREIIFTSGGTEALDLAVRGSLEARTPAGGKGVLVTSAVEHAALRDLGEDLGRSRAQVRLAPLSPGGVIDVGALPPLLAGATTAAFAWANNETGAIQPVEQIGRACREAGVTFVVDGTQWVGKMPADTSSLPADFMAFSPHKFHGPNGVGVLWARAGARLRPRLLGAQELGRRGGTENVPGIAGAGAACAEAAAWLADDARRARLAGDRDEFERLVLAGSPGAVVNGVTAPGARLWNTTNIAFPRLEAEAILMLLSEAGVCASAGAACSSGSLEPSPVLLAMGIDPAVAHGAVRFSLGRDTTPDEVRDAAAIVVRCVARLRGSTGSALGQ